MRSIASVTLLGLSSVGLLVLTLPLMFGLWPTIIIGVVAAAIYILAIFAGPPEAHLTVAGCFAALGILLVMCAIADSPPWY
jgi:hypothetical protein